MNRTVEVEGRPLALTNLDKVLWPETGTTKAELLEYYVAVAPALLPHLEGRPLTLRRFPDGVDGISWHQNEIQSEPEWFPVFETSGRDRRRLRFALVDGLASLVWLANQAVIELHPFLWRVDRPRLPDQVVFDLDPGAPAGLVEAARVALQLRPRLEELELEPLAKTSGSLGMHVHARVSAGLDTKRLARELAEALAEERPREIVAEMRRDLRPGKVFVDWLQNDVTRQTVALYSLRGLPLPTVATPVSWDEVEQAVDERRPEPLVFTLRHVLERLEREGDALAALLET
ncbi:MAG: non-homologous end-joining DNA ligase [Gaiellaceae bacterium]